jgi:hypothetical protein
MSKYPKLHSLLLDFQDSSKRYNTEPDEAFQQLVLFVKEVIKFDNKDSIEHNYHDSCFLYHPNLKRTYKSVLTEPNLSVFVGILSTLILELEKTSDKKIFGLLYLNCLNVLSDIGYSFDDLRKELFKE